MSSNKLFCGCREVPYGACPVHGASDVDMGVQYTHTAITKDGGSATTGKFRPLQPSAPTHRLWGNFPACIPPMDTAFMVERGRTSDCAFVDAEKGTSRTGPHAYDHRVSTYEGSERASAFPLFALGCRCRRITDPAPGSNTLRPTGPCPSKPCEHLRKRGNSAGRKGRPAERPPGFARDKSTLRPLQAVQMRLNPAALYAARRQSLILIFLRQQGLPAHHAPLFFRLAAQ